MRKTKEHTTVFISILIISDYKEVRENKAHTGQVVVAQEKAVWQLFGVRYYDPEIGQWLSRDVAVTCSPES